jgi:hypothetical protein
MRARHFLQVSSAIIGKHRQRFNVTGNDDINSSSNRCALTSHQPNAASYVLAGSMAKPERLIAGRIGKTHWQY